MIVSIVSGKRYCPVQKPDWAGDFKNPKDAQPAKITKRSSFAIVGSVAFLLKLGFCCLSTLG